MVNKTILAAALATLGAGGIGATAYLMPRHTDTVAPPVAQSAEAAAEAAALATSNGMARRDGPALALRLPTGETMRLARADRCGDIPCPSQLAADIRYQGWNPDLGGYGLKVNGKDMVLTYDDQPELQDKEHADPPVDGAMPLPSPPQSVPPDDSVRQWLEETAHTRDDDEAKALGASKGRAERHGDQLTLGLAQGQHLILTDNLLCGDVACPSPLFRSYAFSGLTPDGRYYLIETKGAEDSDALLIDTAKGSVFHMIGMPHFSPNGHVAAVVQSGMPSGPRIELWDITTADGPKQLYQLSPSDDDDSLYEILGWNGDAKLKLRQTHTGGGAATPVILSAENGTWKLANGGR